MGRLLSVLLAGLVGSDAPCAVSGNETPRDEGLEFFEEHVRPLLVKRCYECHAGEASGDAANLRLDYRGGWLGGGDSGPAIDLALPSESLLLKAVSYQDPDLQMPPQSKLSDREIAVLRQWIEAGAPAPDDPAIQPGSSAEEFDLEARRAAHWAWRRVERTTPPSVRHATWPRDDLDRFILAKLEELGLLPAEPTDRATWLRRVTYDLTGLPPSVAELASFLADEALDAEERVVDRLLASQAFGECWGQHWLDLVRFAETKGHEQDYFIPHAWRYRDYVIRALNENVAYDQFVMEHIAGDLLPSPRIDPKTRTNQSIQATGFWHLGEATHSPVDIRGEEAERIDNEIDVFGKAFLGMTVACARCHDHKFDAISTEDYYALCGFVQSSSYQEANVADPERNAQLSRELRALNQIAAPSLLSLYRRQLEARIDALADVRDAQSLPESLRPMLNDALERADHPLHMLAVAADAVAHAVETAVAVQDAADAAGKASGDDSSDDDGEFRAIIDFSQVPRPLEYADWRTSGWGFGDEPTHVGEILLRGAGEGPPLRAVERSAASNETMSPQLTALYRTRTFEVLGPSLWYCYRGAADVFLDVDSHRTLGGPLHAVCQQTLKPSSEWAWQRHDVSDYLHHRVHVDFTPKGAFALAAVGFGEEAPKSPVAPHATLVRAIAARGPKTVHETALATAAELARPLRAIDEEAPQSGDARLLNWLMANEGALPPADTAATEAYQNAVNRYQAQRKSIEDKIPAPQYALALLDGSGENEWIHLRGSHKRLADQPTPRRFLAALEGQMEIQQGSGRLELARRLVDPSNPLPARALVNRVWGILTGQGIVKTVDNLGVLGERPTHPELLDYLAAEFIDSGWNTKQLIRRIVLSSTYRESCVANRQIPAADLAVADPANELLHRARVRRIPAEAIRDALLFVSGELDQTPFGPSVPIHLTDFMRHNRSPAESGPQNGNGRRSIYVEYRRNSLNHFLTAFDKPMPFTTVGRRNESNSPSQSLMLLNDPLVHELAGKWAVRLTAAFGDEASAIDDAYLASFSRRPSVAETESIAAFIHNRMADGQGIDAGTSSRETAWRDVCLALINSKEFIFLP